MATIILCVDNIMTTITAYVNRMIMATLSLDNKQGGPTNKYLKHGNYMMSV